MPKAKPTASDLAAMTFEEHQQLIDELVSSLRAKQPEAIRDQRAALEAAPDPEDWNRPWFFALEVQLWLIPREQRAAALQWEMEREAGLPRKGSLGTRDGKPEPWPWLALAHGERERITAAQSRTPVEVASFDRLEDALGEADPGFSFDTPEILPDPWEPERKLLCLSIDPEGGRKAVEAQVKQLLDQLELKAQSGTNRGDAIDAALIALSVLRLRHWLPGESFHLPLEKTEFQFWGTRNTLPEIKEQADKKRERLKAKVREDYSTEAVHSETHLFRTS